MIVHSGAHYHVVFDKDEITVSSVSAHTVCSVSFAAADWPAVRDAIDKALKEAPK